MSIFLLFYHFLTAFLRSCWWKARGYEIIASRRTIWDRTQTCNVCPDREEDSCGVCKCLILSKASLYSEQCPRKYWLREKVARKTDTFDCV